MAKKTYFYDSNIYCVESVKDIVNGCKFTIFYTEDTIKIPKPCNLIEHVSNCSDNAKVGMRFNDYNYNMAITANLIGFTFIFMLCFLAVLVMRK